MAVSVYFTADDIKDNVLGEFVTADDNEYLLEGDLEVIDQAERLGIRNTDQIEAPLHYKFKRYGIAFICRRIAQDKMGTNNVELAEIEKYSVKYEVYSREEDRLRQQLSYEMITGNITQIRDRTIVSGTVFRG